MVNLPSISVLLIFEKLFRHLVMLLYISFMSRSLTVDKFDAILENYNFFIVLSVILGFAMQKTFLVIRHYDPSDIRNLYFIRVLISTVIFFNLFMFKYITSLEVIILTVLLFDFPESRYYANKLHKIILYTKYTTLLAGAIIKVIILQNGYSDLLILGLFSELILSNVAFSCLLYIRFLKSSSVEMRITLNGLITTLKRHIQAILSDIINIISNRVDLLVITYLALNSSLSSYYLSWQIINLTYFVPMALRSLIVSNFDEFLKIFKWMDKKIMILMPFVCIPLIALGSKLLVKLLYGDSFLLFWWQYFLLSTGAVLGTLGLICNYYFNSKRQFNVIFMRNLFVFCLSVPCSVYLVSRYGVSGAVVNFLVINTAGTLFFGVMINNVWKTNENTDQKI